MTKNLPAHTLPIRSFQIAGFILLFLGSYIDNIRGPLLTIISENLAINYDIASRLLTIGNISACLALISMIPLMKKFSEGKSAKIACGVVIVAGVFAFSVDSLISLYIFAALIGVGTATFGVLSNLIVMRGTKLEDHGAVLAGLQVMYGLASMLAPFAASYVVGADINWRWLFGILVPVAAAFSLFLHISLPDHEPIKEKDKSTFHLSPMQVLLLLTFCFYVVAEVSCSMWMTPYLVETYKMDISEASLYASGFFMFMLLSRLACFFWLRDWNRDFVFMVSLFAPLVLISSSLFFNIPILLPLAGIFGPFWPIFVSKVSQNYPDEWRSLTLWLIIGLQGSLLVMNFSMGKIASILDMQQAYYISPAFQVLTVISFFILRAKSKAF